MQTDEVEATRTRIRALQEKWHQPLGLLWWTVHHVYWDDRRDYAEHSAKHETTATANYEESTAHTTVSWPYMEATIHWNLPLCAQVDDAELEKVFVHECMHVHLHEMRAITTCECPYDLRHEERVAVSLQKVIQWVYEAGVDAGKACKPPQHGDVY